MCFFSRFIILSVVSGLALVYSAAVILLPSTRETILKRRFRFGTPAGVESLVRKTQVRKRPIKMKENSANTNDFWRQYVRVRVLNVIFFLGGWLPTPASARTEYVTARVRWSARRTVTKAAHELQRTISTLHPRDGPDLPKHWQVRQGNRDVSFETEQAIHATLSSSYVVPNTISEKII